MGYFAYNCGIIQDYSVESETLTDENGSFDIISLNILTERGNKCFQIHSGQIHTLEEIKVHLINVLEIAKGDNEYFFLINFDPIKHRLYVHYPDDVIQIYNGAEMNCCNQG